MLVLLFIEKNLKTLEGTKKNTAIIDINDLRVLWRITYRNWYIPPVFILIFYALGYFYTYRLTNIYKVSTQIMLRNNSLFYRQNVINELGGGSGSGGGTDKFSLYVDNVTEMQVLKSYDLIKKAIDKLKDKLQVSYFIVGRVRTTEQFSSIPFEIDINSVNPELYNQQIYFRVIDTSSYELRYVNGGKEKNKIGKFNTECIDLDFNLLVKKTNSITKETIKEIAQIQYLFEIHSMDGLVSQFQTGLTIENPDFTNILQLSYQDIIPERAQLFLDTLSVLYIQNTVEARFDINKRTLDFIDKQMHEVSSVLKEIEDTMQTYKSEKRILDLTKEEADYFQKLSGYEHQKTQLTLQIEALNDLEKYIIENKDPQFLPPSVYVAQGDPFLVKEATELYQLQIKYNEQSNVATAQNFHIQEIENTIKKTKQNLLVYINNSRNATKKIIENINNEIGNYVNDIQTIPKKQRELLGIQRRVSVNENLYTFLLEKRASTFIARATITPESKVIEAPRSTGVVWPDKNRLLTIFAFVGLAISLILILIKVVFFTTLQTIDELKEITKFPVLGDLPFVKNISPIGLIIDSDSRSRVAESFRSLRTNLQYLNVNKGSKVILITSNGPGEGKTFCSINLAGILAKAGKKTLVLELDLHKPRVQKALEMEADIGISTVVIGSTKIPESIKPTRIDNLYVMLSGPIPPNPSEMILSNELREIIEYGKNNFDYIIIDTPPAGLISDAFYLMQYSDISLFVLNVKTANKQILTIINELIEINRIQHFAYILNGVKRTKVSYYNKYGYGYGYGYEYGGYVYGGGYKRK